MGLVYPGCAFQQAKGENITDSFKTTGLLTE